MCSGAGNWTLLQLGFPIRTSPDHSSVVNSPGLIADSYVLHRLLMPRHPPCALSSLSFQQNCYKDARVHYAVLKVRAALADNTSRTRESAPFDGGRVRERCAVTRDPSGPNSVPDLIGLTIRVPLQQAGCTDGRDDLTGQIVDVPLNEQRRLETIARETTHGQATRRRLPTAP